MTWIKICVTTPGKPEVLRLARLLGVTPDDAMGKLFRFWAWLDGVTVDGRVDGVTSTDVDAVVGASGFASCLRSVGWLDIDDDAEQIVAPNFGVHNGETAKKRAEKAARQQRWRGRKVDATVDGRVDAPAPTAAPTREEKRREENKEEEVELRQQLAIPSDYDDPQTLADLAGWVTHLRFTKGNRVPWHSIQKQLELAIAKGQSPQVLRERIAHSIASGSNGSLFDVESSKPKRGKDYSTYTPEGMI